MLNKQDATSQSNSVSVPQSDNLLEPIPQQPAVAEQETIQEESITVTSRLEGNDKKAFIRQRIHNKQQASLQTTSGLVSELGAAYQRLQATTENFDIYELVGNFTNKQSWIEMGWSLLRALTSKKITHVINTGLLVSSLIVAKGYKKDSEAWISASSIILSYAGFNFLKAIKTTIKNYQDAKRCDELIALLARHQQHQASITQLLIPIASSFTVNALFATLFTLGWNFVNENENHKLIWLPIMITFLVLTALANPLQSFILEQQSKKLKKKKAKNEIDGFANMIQHYHLSLSSYSEQEQAAIRTVLNEHSELAVYL